MVKTLPSFVEDTQDFLVSLEKLKNENLPDDVFPVSIDVSLHGSIPPEDAMKTVKYNLDCRTEDGKQSMPTSFLMSLLRMVFQFNTFEFDGEHYQQSVGIASGTVASPSIVNLDKGAREQFITSEMNPHVSRLYKRYWRRHIDDIFILFQATEEQLKIMMSFMNGI